MSSNLESVVKAGIFDSSNFCKSVEKINGRHIVLQAPNRSGSFYFNYNKNHPIVSMALSDKGMFLLCYIGIGDLGLASDGGAFNNKYPLNE